MQWPTVALEVHPAAALARPINSNLPCSPGETTNEVNLMNLGVCGGGTLGSGQGRSPQVLNWKLERGEMPSNAKSSWPPNAKFLSRDDRHTWDCGNGESAKTQHGLTCRFAESLESTNHKSHLVIKTTAFALHTYSVRILHCLLLALKCTQYPDVHKYIFF